MCYHSKRFPLRHAHWPPPLVLGANGTAIRIGVEQGIRQVLTLD
jgi:hypothetical protein